MGGSAFAVFIQSWLTPQNKKIWAEYLSSSVHQLDQNCLTRILHLLLRRPGWGRTHSLQPEGRREVIVCWQLRWRCWMHVQEHCFILFYFQWHFLLQMCILDALIQQCAVSSQDRTSMLQPYCWECVKILYERRSKSSSTMQDHQKTSRVLVCLPFANWQSRNLFRHLCLPQVTHWVSFSPWPFNSVPHLGIQLNHSRLQLSRSPKHADFAWHHSLRFIAGKLQHMLGHCNDLQGTLTAPLLIHNIICFKRGMPCL